MSVSFCKSPARTAWSAACPLAGLARSMKPFPREIRAMWACRADLACPIEPGKFQAPEEFSALGQHPEFERQVRASAGESA